MYEADHELKALSHNFQGLQLLIPETRPILSAGYSRHLPPLKCDVKNALCVAAGGRSHSRFPTNCRDCIMAFMSSITQVILLTSHIVRDVIKLS